METETAFGLEGRRESFGGRGAAREFEGEGERGSVAASRLVGTAGGFIVCAIDGRVCDYGIREIGGRISVSFRVAKMEEVWWW